MRLCVQLDMDDLYAREGDAPLRALHAALAAADDSSAAAALRGALQVRDILNSSSRVTSQQRRRVQIREIDVARNLGEASSGDIQEPCGTGRQAMMLSVHQWWRWF